MNDPRNHVKPIPGKLLTFPMGWGGRRVYGGRYYDSVNLPAKFFKVKMAKEIGLPCDANVPTKDYSVPTIADLEKAIEQTLKAMSQNKPIYVGCMGGIGRTGLFLGVLARVFGIDNPIVWVRTQYNSHAIETLEQEAFVKGFPIRKLQLSAKKYKRLALIKFWM